MKKIFSSENLDKIILVLSASVVCLTTVKKMLSGDISPESALGVGNNESCEVSAV